MAGCRLRGAEQIVAIDLSEERLAMARHHGATHTMLAGDGVVDALRELTGGYGCDYTFEATGNVAVMRQAVESAREAWGLATMIGVAGKGELLEIVPRFLITGRRVTGSSFGGVKGRSQVPGLVQLWMDGELDVDSMLSHRMHAGRRERGVRPDAPPGRHPLDPDVLDATAHRAARTKRRGGFSAKSRKSVRSRANGAVPSAPSARLPRCRRNER